MKRILTLASLVVLCAVTADAGDKACSGTTQECLDYMTKQMRNSGWVGVEMEPLEDGGYVLIKVVKESPAEEAGLRADDVLLSINGIKVNDADSQKELKAARAEWKPGTSVTWSMTRGDADRQVEITLAPMPADLLARYIGQHMLEHATVEMAAN